MTAAAQPLVSVCVPTYNDGRFLGEMLASVVGQTYQNLEIIVGDDASTDRTAQVVASIGDPRIRYHRNDRNLGQFDNINRCIGLARGEFVAIYHSDDVYEPTIVEKEVGFLLEHHAAGAVFALDTYIGADGRPFGRTSAPPGVPRQGCVTLEDVIPVLLRHKNRLLRAPTFMARAAALAEVGSYEPTRYDIAGDLDYYLRLLERYPVGIVHEPLLRYRCDPSQVSSRYERLRTVEEHFFPIVDRYLSGRVPDVTVEDLTEYEFHRCDDRTTRAANHVILGNVAVARDLLRRPFPWRSLRNGVTRRKVRVLLLRAGLRAGLAVRARRPLARVAARTEYGTWGTP